MSELTNAPPRKRRMWPAVTLLAIYFLIASNWLHPLLRFSSQTVNSLVILAGFCLPWIALVFVWRLQIKIFSRVYITVTLLPFMLYTSIFGFAISKTLNEPEPPVVATVQMGGYRVVLYRIASGDASGIAVQQERDFIPGVMWVQRLPGFYPAATAQYQIVAQNELRIAVPAYAPDHPETAKTEVYSLKPYLYF